MSFANIKRYVFKSKLGKVIIGTYAIYLVALIIASAMIGVQLGTELRSVPAHDRAQYIETFLSNKF